MIFLDTPLIVTFKILNNFNDSENQQQLLLRSFILSSGIHVINIYNIISLSYFLIYNSNFHFYFSIIIGVISYFILFLYFRKKKEYYLNSILKSVNIYKYIIVLIYIVSSFFALFKASNFIIGNN